MRVGEAKHSVRDPAPELTTLGVYLARVKFRIVAGETGEGHEVRIGDRPPWTPEGHSNVQVGVCVAESSFVAHR